MFAKHHRVWAACIYCQVGVQAVLYYCVVGVIHALYAKQPPELLEYCTCVRPQSEAIELHQQRDFSLMSIHGVKSSKRFSVRQEKNKENCPVRACCVTFLVRRNRYESPTTIQGYVDIAPRRMSTASDYGSCRRLIRGVP